VPKELSLALRLVPLAQPLRSFRTPLLRVYLLEHVLTADLDLALVFAGLSEIIRKLHPQPRFRCAPKRLRKPDCHFRANPGLAVDDIVERLPGYAKDLGSLRDGQA
jgi:hypothetical protein